MAAEAFGLFAIPLLSGTRPVPLAQGAIAFLREHIGLQRFYTLGPFAPNYSAYFQIGSINHNYLPVPRRWVDFVRAHLDPAANDVAFTGNFPGDMAGQETRTQALRRRLPAYAAIGVKYVLTLPDADPFPTTLSTPTSGGPATAQSLGHGDAARGTIPGEHVRSGDLARVVIQAHGGGGDKSGMITIRVCNTRNNTCADAAETVPPAATGDVSATLQPPLAVVDGDNLSYAIEYRGGAPGFIDLFPTAANLYPGVTTSTGEHPHQVPRMTFAYDKPLPAKRVYHDAIMDIHELQQAAPYFEVQGGACRITPLDRQAVVAECAAAAKLIRRELFYPGWQATVNTATVALQPQDDLFQQIDLPPGRSEVRFTYAPPQIRWISAAFIIGLAGLLVGTRRGMQARGDRSRTSG